MDRLFARNCHRSLLFIQFCYHFSQTHQRLINADSLLLHGHIRISFAVEEAESFGTRQIYQHAFGDSWFVHVWILKVDLEGENDVRSARSVIQFVRTDNLVAHTLIENPHRIINCLNFE